MSNFAVQMLPLSALRVDEKSNVRKIGRGVDPILVASIRAIGLRNPLTVRKNGTGYVVIDGGQRLAALQEIATADKIANWDVPCIAGTEKDLEASEVSLQLNLARSDMHPVDQYLAFADLAAKGIPAATIAKRFSIAPRRVDQLLALGALEPTVLAAYAKDELSADAVRAFTMIASPKTQLAVLAKIRKGDIHPNAYNIRRAVSPDDKGAGKFLTLIGEEAYAARGGKVTRDLFGTDHIVSDTALVTAMINELLDAKCKELLADGWKWASSEEPASFWNYPRVAPKFEPTKAEEKQLKSLKAIVEANEDAEEFDQARDDAAEVASEAYDKLTAEIGERAITPAIKAKAGVYVSVHHKGDALELDYRYEPKAAPVSKVEAAKKEKAKAAKKAAPEDNVSQALMVRLAEQLNAATQATILNHPNVAMAALIGALASYDDVVGIHAGTKKWDAKHPAFAPTFQSALKLTTAKQIEILTGHVSKALKLIDYAQKTPALDNPANKALAEAVDGKKLTAALREKFDAKDFFDSVSRATIVDAVREGMGDDHATKVNSMDKAAAAKFATANLPKTKWLPKQLRVGGYDGPAKKAKAKAKAKR